MKDYKKILKGVVNIIAATEKTDIGFADICSYIGENCPELKESEDEKIKKWIIDEIRYNMGNELFNNSEYKKKAEKAISWLEKQGDTNETINRDEFAQGVLRGAATNLIAWIDYNATEDNMRLSKMECKDIEDALVSGHWDKIYAYIKKKLENQGEQKSTDKVEPKFHEGEWIIDNCGNIWEIEGIRNQFYILEGIEGDESLPTIECVDKTFHPWTIQDAKDGDILVVEPIDGYQFPFVAIYKNRGLDFFNSYCFIGFNGKFYGADVGHALDDIHPATKEQRELLFQKMDEAGYVFDFEKKELKKIKQESTTWSEEDEEMLDGIILRCEKYGYQEQINWLKSLIERYTWKPSDEQINALFKLFINKACKWLENHNDYLRIHDNGRGVRFDMTQCIIDFRKAMKGE